MLCYSIRRFTQREQGLSRLSNHCTPPSRQLHRTAHRRSRSPSTHIPPCAAGLAVVPAGAGDGCPPSTVEFRIRALRLRQRPARSITELPVAARGVETAHPAPGLCLRGLPDGSTGIDADSHPVSTTARCKAVDMQPLESRRYCHVDHDVLATGPRGAVALAP